MKKIKLKKKICILIISLFFLIIGGNYILPNNAYAEYIYNANGEGIYINNKKEKVFPYSYTTYRRGENGKYDIEKYKDMQFDVSYDNAFSDANLVIPAVIYHHFSADTIPLIATKIKDEAFREYRKSAITSDFKPDLFTVEFPYQKNEDGTIFALSEIGNDAFRDSLITGTLLLRSARTRYSIGTETYKLDVKIGSRAFYGCKYLKNVNLKDCKIKSIESQTFMNCTGLETVTLSDDLEIIKTEAFKDCDNLKSITIPKNVKTIESFAFSGCINLEKVVLPEGLETIGEYAFMSCKNKEIVIPKSVKQIGSHALYGVDTIYCYKDSYAEEYAKNNGKRTVILDEQPRVTVSQIGNSLKYSIEDNNSGIWMYQITDPSGKVVKKEFFAANTKSKSGSVNVTKSGKYKLYAENWNFKDTTVTKNVEFKKSRK